MFPLIKELTELVGPVGQERIVLERVARLWAAAGARVEVSRIGTVIGRAGGQGPRLLLVAHADELCYLVRSIDPGGFLWLANGQGWHRTTSLRNWFAVGQRVNVLARSGSLRGVLAAVTGHLATAALREPAELTWDDFWVDTGLSADELRARGVSPGTRVIWDAETTQLGPQAALMRADVPAALVAFPARYTHSPFETGHLGDIEALVRWLCAFVAGG